MKDSGEKEMLKSRPWYIILQFERGLKGNVMTNLPIGC